MRIYAQKVNTKYSYKIYKINNKKFKFVLLSLIISQVFDLIISNGEYSTNINIERDCCFTHYIEIMSFMLWKK